MNPTAHPNPLNGSPLSTKSARQFGALLLQLSFATRPPSAADSDPAIRNQAKILQEAQRAFPLGASSIGVLQGSRAKTALTTSDIPGAEDFNRELSLLIGQYGVARRLGRVVPIRRATKLPKLTTLPDIEYLDESEPLSEVVPQMEWVTLTPRKAMALVRTPSEFPADDLALFGAFFAEYAAAAVAYIEDTTFFLADGSATYKTQVGCLKAAANAGNKVQLGAGSEAPTQITLASLRTLRTRVNRKVLNQPGCAYFMHRSHDELLSSLNAGTDCFKQTADGATLDGYPIRWVDVMPVYDSTAAASQLQVLFGNPKFQALGLHEGLLLAASDVALFTTDEILFKVGERLVTENLNSEALAVLQLAAA